jgi:hypothetical protein
MHSDKLACNKSRADRRHNLTATRKDEANKSLMILRPIENQNFLVHVFYAQSPSENKIIIGPIIFYIYIIGLFSAIGL